jgi:hypothetical protein
VALTIKEIENAKPKDKKYNPMAERKAEAEAKQEEVRAIPQRIQPESARFRLGAFELSNLSFIGNLSV